MARESEPLRAMVEVTAGVLPGQPEDEFTRRYPLTGTEWESSEDRSALLVETNGKALGYAGLLMASPNRFNWVRTDWVWF